MNLSTKDPLVADFVAAVRPSRGWLELLQRMAITHQDGWNHRLGQLYSEVFLQAPVWKELMSRHGVDDIRMGVIAALLMEFADLQTGWPAKLQDELEAAVRDVLKRWDTGRGTDKKLRKRLASSRFWVPIAEEAAAALEVDDTAFSIRHTLLLQTAVAFGVGWRSVGECKSFDPKETGWNDMLPQSHSQLFGLASGIVGAANKSLSQVVPGFERRKRDDSVGSTPDASRDVSEITEWTAILLGQYLEFPQYESAFITLCGCAAISASNPGVAISEVIDLWETRRDRYLKSESLLSKVIEQGKTALKIPRIKTPDKSTSRKLTEEERNHKWHEDYFKLCFGPELPPNWKSLWERLEDSFGGDRPGHEIMLLLRGARDILVYSGQSAHLLGQDRDFSDYESELMTLCGYVAISASNPDVAIKGVIDLWNDRRDQFLKSMSLLREVITQAGAACKMPSINPSKINTSTELTEEEPNHNWHEDYFKYCFGPELPPNWKSLWERLEESFGGERAGQEIMFTVRRTRDFLVYCLHADDGLSQSLSKGFLPKWDPLNITLDDHLEQFILGRFDARPGKVLKANALRDSAFGQLLVRERVIAIEPVAFDVCAKCGEYSFTSADILQPEFLKSSLTELDSTVWDGFLPDLQFLADWFSSLSADLRSTAPRKVAEVTAEHLNRLLGFEAKSLSPRWRSFLKHRLTQHRNSNSWVTGWIERGLEGANISSGSGGKDSEFDENNGGKLTRSIVVSTALALLPVLWKRPNTQCPIAIEPSGRRRSIHGRSWKDRPCGHVDLIVKTSPWVFVPDRTWRRTPFFKCENLIRFGEHYNSITQIANYLETQDTEEEVMTRSNPSGSCSPCATKKVTWKCTCGCACKSNLSDRTYLWVSDTEQHFKSDEPAETEFSTHLHNDHE